MRKRIRAVVSTLLVVAASVLCAETVTAQQIRDPRAVFDRANDAYKNQRFDAAIAGYRRLLAAGYRHTEIHYNLGNAYFRTGALGRALAQYERARRLRPRDPIIRENIALLRNRTQDMTGSASMPGFIARTLFWYRAVNRPEILVLAAAAYILFWLVLSARLVWRRTVLARVAVVLACIGVLLGASVLAKTREERPGSRGVLVSDAAVVRAGPEQGSRELFELHDGAEVAVEEDSAGWYRIALADGKRGWVKADKIETL